MDTEANTSVEDDLIVGLSVRDVRMLHRVMSSGLIADPYGTNDSLRKKLAQQLFLYGLSREIIEHEREDDVGSGVPSRAIQTVEGRDDRVESHPD